MDFESLTATTGIASSFNNLYVVNNKTLMVVDQYGDKEEIPHDFDYITNITTSELKVFGIYKKGANFGLFSMDMDSQTFKMVPVTYTPVNLIYFNQLIVVLDTEFIRYEYEKNLSLRGTYSDMRDNTNSIHFMTIALASDDQNLYWSKVKDIYTEKGKLMTVDGNILSMVCYSKHLFIIYNSLYNYYSILQYDLENKKNVRTVDGGHISGPPIYSCIYEDLLYISASTNNKISLTLFSIPGKITTPQNRPRSVYPMFELSKSKPQFITEDVNMDIEKIKTLRDYEIVDTTPAKNSLLRYYIWLFIFLFIVIVLLLAFFFRQNSVLPIILLAILFIGLSFIIKNRYFI